MATEDPDLIGTSEVCRIVDKTPTTVTRWVADGTLVAVHKLPGKNGALLFNRADVEKFAAERLGQSA